MSGRSRLAFGAIALATAASVLPVAGAVRAGALAAAAMSLLCALPYLSSRRRFEKLPPLLVFYGAAIAAALLQLVPLPAALVGILSPNTLDLIESAHRAAGAETPGWLPLSLEPSATLVELAKLCGYLAIAWAALRVSEGPKGRRLLRLLVSAMALALIAIAVAHRIVGERRLLFGLYEPITYAPRLLTPFININHLSGMLVACAFVFLGLSTQAGRDRRPIFAFFAITCVAVSLFVPSRGAALGLVSGGLVAAAIVWVGRRRRSSTASLSGSSLRLILGALAGIAILVALFGGGLRRDLGETSVAELSDENSKFGAWRSAIGLIGDFPMTGVGRGAFETVFPSHHAASRARVYSHVENEYLQVIVDHGVVAGTLLIALLVWVVVLGIRRGTKSTTAACTMGALTAILSQNFFDFSLALPGTMCPFIVLASTLTYGKFVGAERSNRLLVTRVGLFGTGLAIVVLAALSSRSVREDRHELRAELADGGRTEGEIVELARPHLLRHPADGLLAAEAAKGLFRAGSPRSFAYLAWAQERYPNHSGTHYLAARMLRAADRKKQALGAYRRAIENGGKRAYIQELAALYPDPADVLAGLPTKLSTQELILRELGRAKRPDAAYLYGQRALNLGSPAPGVRLATAQAALAIGQFPEAVRLARKGLERTDTLEIRIVLARALAKLKRVSEASKVLQEAMPQASTSDRVRALGTLASLLEEAGDLNGARLVYRKISNFHLADVKARADAHRSLARLERQLGNQNRAVWEERSARRLLRR